MSLIEQKQRSYQLRTETSVDDGAGGKTSTYTYGDPFKGAQTVQQDVIDTKQGKHKDYPEYKLFISKSITLKYGDILKRDDGKLYIVESETDYHNTPNSSNLNLAKVLMREYGGVPNG